MAIAFQSTANQRPRPGWRALLLAAPAAGAALALAPPDAGAATYAARPAGGGRIALEVVRDRLRRIELALPARCDRNSGGSWRTRLAIDVRDSLALQAGRFGLQGQAPDKVRYQLDGRLRGTAITGRVRLTYLDLDFVGVDDSYLCDTQILRYRAVRRR